MAFTSKRLKQLNAAGVNPEDALLSLGFAQVSNYKEYLEQIQRIRAEARAAHLSDAEASQLVNAYASGGRASDAYKALNLLQEQRKPLALSQQVEALFKEMDAADEQELKSLSQNLKATTEEIKAILAAQGAIQAELFAQQAAVDGDEVKVKAIPGKPTTLIKDVTAPPPELGAAIISAPVAEPDAKPSAPAIDEAAAPSIVESPSAPKLNPFDPSNNEAFAKLEAMIDQHKKLQIEITSLKNKVESGDATPEQLLRLNSLQEQMTNLKSSFVGAKAAFDAVHSELQVNLEMTKELSAPEKNLYLDRLDHAAEYANNLDNAANLSAANSYSQAADAAELTSSRTFVENINKGMSDEAARTLETPTATVVDANSASAPVSAVTLANNPQVADVAQVADIGDPNNSPFELDYGVKTSRPFGGRAGVNDIDAKASVSDGPSSSDSSGATDPTALSK